MNRQQQWLKDLEIPIKSFRIAALENLIKTAKSQDELDCLYQLKEEEKDPECLFLFEHAILSIKKRKESQELSDKKESPKNFNEYSPFEKANFIRKLKKADAESLTDQSLEWLRQEDNQLVKSEIIKKFGKLWPETQLQELTIYLTEKSFCLKSATLEVLSDKSPELLPQYMPQLLGSADSGMKALAAKALSKFDPAEAAKYLNEMLQSTSKLDRLAGLRTCLIMPFPQVKNILLNFLINETDIEVIRKIGLVFRVNPDIETPLKLWEITENSEGEKKNEIKKIIQNICDSIKKSKQLKENYNNYMERLQNWINLRSSRNFVQQWLLKIRSNSEMAGELINIAKAKCSNKFVLDAFKDALDWPISDIEKEMVQIVIGQKKNVIIDESQKQLSEEKNLIKTIRECQKDQEGINLLKNTFALKEPSENVTIQALKKAAKLKLPLFKSNARKLLKDDNARINALALEYLAEVDPEDIMPRLGKFLASPNSSIKISALKILRKSDPQQASSTMMAMFDSLESKDLKKVVNALIYFDFALIRDRLTEFLLTRKGKSIAKASLCLFLSNPDPENLFLLFKIEQSSPPGLRQEVARTRKKTFALLKKLDRVDYKNFEQSEEACQNKFNEELLSDKKLYSLKKQKENAQAAKPNNNPEKDERKQILVVIAVTSAVLLIIFILLFSSDDIASTKPSKSLRGKSIPVPQLDNGKEKLNDGLGQPIVIKSSKRKKRQPPK